MEYNLNNLHLSTPAPFDFRATCRSHGWVVLAPFRWDDERTCLYRIDQLQDGTVVALEVEPADDESITVIVRALTSLADAERAEVKKRVRWMLRLDEDLSEFYTLVEEHPRWHKHVTPGAGRLLRAPDFFEDIVKTICTTNISWAGTKRMVSNLVQRFGAPLDSDDTSDAPRAFPTPAVLANAGESALKETGLGYRAPYVADLAHRVAAGDLNLNVFTQFSGTSDELRSELLTLKGIGPYGAATLLMLLGHYDYLAIDSAMRSFVATHYFDGTPPTEKAILDLYESWGDWKYLAYWFDPGWEDL